MCWGLLNTTRRSVLCKKHGAEVFPSSLGLLGWSSQDPRGQSCQGSMAQGMGWAVSKGTRPCMNPDMSLKHSGTQLPEIKYSCGRGGGLEAGKTLLLRAGVSPTSAVTQVVARWVQLVHLHRSYCRGFFSVILGPSLCAGKRKSIKRSPAVLGTQMPLSWGQQLSPELQAAARPGVVCRGLSLQIPLPCRSCSFRGNLGLPSWACSLSLGNLGGLHSAVPCLMPLLANCSSL